MPTGAELFVDAIQSLWIDRIFTLVGDHLNEVLEVAGARGIPIFDMRHESGVTHAADAWARITRRPSLSLVTGGPGHTNSLTGIATAFLAASPLIAVSGSRPTTAADRQGFQDIDQIGMVKPVVKWAAQPPNASQIPFYLGRAYAEAVAGRMGPVHLTIPVDLFQAEAGAPAALPSPPARIAIAPGASETERLLSLLRAAERPVVIAGSGVWWSEAEDELRVFIEKTQIPLYTITMARGLVSDEHPLCMGYADPALNRVVLDVYREADLILVLGKRIDFRFALGGQRVFPASARIVQVDIHPQELGMNRRLELGICADVKATLMTLLDAIRDEPGWTAGPWLTRVREWKAQWESRLAEASYSENDALHAAAFHRELKKALPPRTLFSWDAADFAHWGRAIVPALTPGGWLRLGPLATIGSGLPNALALQLANPGKPVALVSGDGSFGFYIAELDTAVRHNLPVVFIIGNDAGWGLERELQRAATGRTGTVACELRPTRYDLVMKGFGGEGETIRSLDEVQPAVRRAFASGKPYVLNVEIRGLRSPFSEWQIAGKKRA
jgi:acetolactate synthase-1/2/3 large subunit